MLHASRFSELSVTTTPQLAAAELAEALAFNSTAASGSYLQRPDWPQLCPPPARHRYLVLRACHGQQLVGLGLARLTRLGPRSWLATLRRGPVTRTIADLAAVVPAMAQALRGLGVCSLVINPRWCDAQAAEAIAVLKQIGAQVLPASDQSLHRATLVVDLPGGTNAAATLDASLKQRCRRQLRKAEAMGLTTRPVQSLDEAMLYEPILADFHARRGLSRENLPSVAAQWHMTQERGAFLLGWLQGRPICGHTVIADGDRAFWLTMASLEGHPDLPKNYQLIHHALQICQRQGFASYDMAGTPSREAADKPDQAAENRDQFKTAFDPRYTELVPAMVLPLKPAEHAILFSLRQKWRQWGKVTT